ncbi:hypothetical protein G6L37_07150 [Agrobacterium rubi]|nr:hypothetical protein [Agrobacterium rubi]NTF25143.1 hypothetical protein [Agrobacterium rubi]
MTKITLYHGTARAFTEFTADYTMRGSEPNSALGIHLTECPVNAAEYARKAASDLHGSSPRVLIAEVDVGKIAVVDSAADYLGRDPEVFDPDTNRTRSEFVERRLELQAMGFDAVATSETELSEVDSCWAVFDPARIRIIGEMSVEEADDLDLDEGFQFDGIEFDAVVLFPQDPCACL